MSNEPFQHPAGMPTPPSAWLRERIRNKYLRAKCGNMWIKNERKKAEIRLLKKQLDKQTKATIEALDGLQKSEEKAWNYRNLLVKQKEDSAIFNRAQENTRLVLTQLKARFDEQNVELQDFRASETRLTTQLQEAKESYKKELEELQTTAGKINQEIAQVRRKMQTLKKGKRKWKKRCLDFQNGLHFVPPFNPNPPSPSCSTSSPSGVTFQVTPSKSQKTLLLFFINLFTSFYISLLYFSLSPFCFTFRPARSESMDSAQKLYRSSWADLQTENLKINKYNFSCISFCSCARKQPNKNIFE